MSGGEGGWGIRQNFLFFFLAKPFVGYPTETFLFLTFFFFGYLLFKAQDLYISKSSQLIFYQRALPVVIGLSATCFGIDFLC